MIMSLVDAVLGARLSLALGALAVLALWESIDPFLPLFSGRHATGSRVAHGARNVAIGLVNALVVRFGFLGAWTAVAAWSDAHAFGIRAWIGGPAWLQWAVVLLLLDCWTYVWHRLNHTVPLLWRFHRLHHSDREMDVTTANRFHLGEIVLSSLARLPLLALLGASMLQLAVYETILFAVVQFHHANVAVPEPIDRLLRAIVVTPHLHRVHHSVVVAEQNANFSSVLTWWDRVARTLRVSPNLADIRFGIDDEPAAN
ncbi:sterol desaturase family protein [Gemmatimonas sp.]|jgi:sterol desaturase/sphingolipid hydroxylase (fatty acid hydroxylase superfamily)|uniref:sterol desaturase family protein n=1 Tax=Gemmatimonas sp. TaxID=1962908 RepID=UPI0022CCED82|nr:sterol desaturase family protein [Gemmatimonas sp.]MCZ8206372.1 sterol desaturase family protein [Gemmatimonas sp.]